MERNVLTAYCKSSSGNGVDNKIAFFDTLVTRKPDGKLLTNSQVYIENPHTSTSSSPMIRTTHKRGIFKRLHDRATAQEKKKSIHSSRRQRLPSVPLKEGDQNQESNTQEGNNRIQVYRSAAMHQRSLGTPPPPPTATRNTHRLHSLT